ncbi:MAG: hypothetical protein WCE81_09830 [Halobacteriota archaeon]
MKYKCDEKSCPHYTECQLYFDDPNVTKYEKSKSVSGKRLCIFYWGTGRLKAMER